MGPLHIVYTATEAGPLALDLYLPPGLWLGERRRGVVFVYGDGHPGC